MCYLFQVQWHPVFWGIAIQFMFAMLILRTYWGYQIFRYLGERITVYLSYADTGAIFVFGKSYKDHMFAFKVWLIYTYICLELHFTTEPCSWMKPYGSGHCLASSPLSYSTFLYFIFLERTSVSCR